MLLCMLTYHIRYCILTYRDVFGYLWIQCPSFWYIFTQIFFIHEHLRVWPCLLLSKWYLYILDKHNSLVLSELSSQTQLGHLLTTTTTKKTERNGLPDCNPNIWGLVSFSHQHPCRAPEPPRAFSRRENEDLTNVHEESSTDSHLFFSLICITVIILWKQMCSFEL